MPDWKFNLHSIADHSFLGQLEAAKGRQVSPALNNPGACQCRIPLENDLAYIIEPHTSYIRCLRDNVEKYRARVLTTTESVPDGMMMINCVGFWEIVNHRYTTAEIVFTNKTCGEIANLLLKHAQLVHGALGFYVNPVDPVVGFVIPKLTVPKDANVGEWIKKLTTVENGIDFKFDPVNNWYNFYPTSGPGQLGIDRVDAHFGWEAGPTPNLASAIRTKDGARTVNSMKVISQNSSASIPYQTDAASIAIRNAWCEVQTIGVRNDPPGSEGYALAAYAAAELVIRSKHVTTYTVTPMTDGSGLEIPSAWDDFDLVDTVRFHVDRGAFKVVNEPIRVFGWTCDIDDDTGAERLSSLALSP